MPLQSIPAAHPGSVCGSGDNKGLCGQAEGRKQSVIGSLNSLAHSSGMPNVFNLFLFFFFLFCFIQNSRKCAHSQQTSTCTVCCLLLLASLSTYSLSSVVLAYTHTQSKTHKTHAFTLFYESEFQRRLFPHL